MTDFASYEAMWSGTVIESKHPYDKKSDLYWDVSILDADEGIEVRFDPQSKTKEGWDYVRFYKDATHTEYWGEEEYSGGRGSKSNFPSVAEPLLIPASSFVVHFHSGRYTPDWGFKLVASAKGRQGVPLTPLQTVRSAELKLLLVETQPP